MYRELDNKIAIVTGASRGIGSAIADVLVREGATVIVVARDAESARAKAEALGGDCTFFAADIAKTDETRALVDFVLERFGRIDILVNNAGITQNVGFLDITEEEFDRVVDINLRGTVFLTQKVMDHMIQRNYGRVVNIASMAGERGGLYAGIHYSTSKAGVINATKCMAYCGGPHNVTVNAVAPGLIRTAMAEALNFTADGIAAGRLGTPEEVGEVVAFLASDRARYITGSTVDVNGGQLMR